MASVRIYAAALALAIPAGVFALNALISVRERGLVEPWDVVLLVAFAGVAAWTIRGSRIALALGTTLVAIMFATAIPGGPVQFLVYWIVALVLVLQAFYAGPIARRAT